MYKFTDKDYKAVSTVTKDQFKTLLEYYVKPENDSCEGIDRRNKVESITNKIRKSDVNGNSSCYTFIVITFENVTKSNYLSPWVILGEHSGTLRNILQAYAGCDLLDVTEDKIPAKVWRNELDIMIADTSYIFDGFNILK